MSNCILRTASVLFSWIVLATTALAAEPDVHWAYVPSGHPATPHVRNIHWPASTIDRFVLNRLEEEEIEPVAAADRRTLFRRLSFDLWGLPPEPADLAAFVADLRPDALERTVDRMLADPRFGQRWGRHWLDVARFAESLTLRGFIFPEAWRYRDYVIDAFNADLPYDQFVREQIAGDLLPSNTLEERRRHLVATTVLMLGNTNLEEQDKQQLEMDLIDDQLDLIGRGFLGQTLSCARCHDHKFDPISTAEYYGLAGILKGAKSLAHENVSKWLEVPLPLEPDQEAPLAQFETELAAVKARLDGAKTALAKVTGENASVKSIAVAKLTGIVIDDSKARKVGEWTQSTSVSPYVGDGYLHDQDSGKGDKSLTFQPEIPTAGQYEVRFAYTPGGNRTPRAPVTVFSADGEQTVFVDQQKAPPLDRVWISLGKFRFEANGAGYVIVGNTDTKGHVVADAVQFLPVTTEADSPVAETKLTAETTPTSPEAERELTRLRSAVNELEVEFKKLQANAHVRPKAMSIVEQSDPQDLFIHLRGSVHSRGPIAPRGFPKFARATSGADTPPQSIPPGESGRRQLADWLASPENPLVARVYVNRVWHWLLGRGLVRSTDNFGTTGDLPTHPELLDHLARTFVDDGCSTKRLVRQIVLSRVYQLSDADFPTGAAIDPDNRLLWHHAHRRLDAEELRDAMLLASGELSHESGGPTYPRSLNADYGFVSSSTRRSVYLPVFRNAIPDLFEAFDFADPSSVTGARAPSTVAPQALTLLNHPFVVEQSAAIARRLLREASGDPRQRVEWLFQRLLARDPSDPELRISLEFLEESPNEGDIERLGRLIQSLLGTIEFRYVR
ncbi:MAG: DUF1553 domain-containing protein [Planctomycetota bacterium]|nr:DUF1553 domain-containing protein [Planctomycetota bacterium]